MVHGCCLPSCRSRCALLLLSHHRVPVPDIYDEFGHLFVADTLRHFRLANPAHPLHQFFETFFTLQQPTYSSIYPIGQGLMLAIGRALFGTPWAGVLISTAALCSLCYWMLRAWVSPAWALAGGMLAVFEFGPLSPVDEQLLGRRIGRGGRMPGIRRASPVDGNPQDGAMPWRWASDWRCICSSGHTNRFSCFFSVALFFAPVLRRPKPRQNPAAARRTHCGRANGSGSRDHASAEPRDHRQLDYAALSAQPISIRRSGGPHLPGQSHSSRRADPAAGTGLQIAIGLSVRGSGNAGAAIWSG